MSRSTQYYFLKQTADNRTFIDFQLRQGSTITASEAIPFTGAASI